MIVTKAKGEKYSPMQIRMLTEMLPEDANEYIKFGAGLLEAAGDVAVVGAGANKFKKSLLTDAANNTIDKLKKAGYKVTPEQEQQFKSEVGKRAESISPDDAVAINIKTKMAKVPKNTEVPDAGVKAEPKQIDIGVGKSYTEKKENITLKEDFFEKARNTSDKDRPYYDFIMKHKDNIESLPETIENPTKKMIMNKLNLSPNNKQALIATPEGDVIIQESHIDKLLNRNEPQRATFFNRALATLERPNEIIIDKEAPNKKMYIKIFGNDGIYPHVTVVKVAEDGKFYVTNFPVTARHKLIAILDKKPNTEVLDFKAQNTNELSNSQKIISDGTNIIGQNNDGVNNLESDAIETGNENVDTSFEPAEFDEEYANAMEEQKKLLIEEMKENGAIPTIKSEKQRLQDMGIGKMLRPKKNDPMYEEYKHLSPRIQREFFYDESDGIVNKSKGYTWDNAEHDLQQATGTDITIWEELENIDRNVSKYENLGLANGGKGSEIEEKINNNFEPIKAKDDTIINFVNLDDKKLIPNFDTVKNLKKAIFKIIEETGPIEVKQSNSFITFSKDGIGRGLKRAREDRNKQFFADLKKIVENAVYAGFKPADKEHTKVLGQGIYYTAMKIGEQHFAIEIETDVALNQKNNKYPYVGHKVKEINIKNLNEKSQGIDTAIKSVYNPDNITVAHFNKIFKNKFVERPKQWILTEKNNDNGNASYSSVLKTGVKVGAEETPKEADFKLYQRTYDLAKKYMKGNIAESKYRPKNSLGVYYNYGSGKGNIFIKSLNTIDVVAHELVHAIDDELGISRNLLDSGNVVESELIRACKELYPVNLSKKPKEIQLLEGMASLVQHLVVNPEIAKRYPQAANFIRSNEKLNNFVQDARQIIVDYESQNNVQKVKSEIYDRPINTVNKKKIPLRVKLDSQFFDSEAVLRWLDEDLYIAAKGYKTVLKGVIENNLTNNKGIMYILDKDGNPKKVSDAVNWKTFIEYAGKTGKEFNTFLVARRFFNWYKQRDKLVNLIEIDTNNLKSLVEKLQKTQLVIANTGLQKELDAAKRLENKLNAEIHRLQNRINSNSEKLHDLKDIIKNHGKDENVMKDVYATLNTPENQKLAADYDFLIDCNLQTLKNAGLLTKEMYKEFSENEGYTPFNKVAYDEIAGDGGVEFVSRFAPNSVNVKNFKKIKGSELPIVSPLYSSVHFMTEAYKKAYRQIVYNKLGEVADMFPELMQKVQYVQGMEKDSSMIVARNDKGVRYGVKIDPFIKRVIEGVSNIVKPDWMSNMLLVPARFFTNMTTGLYPLYAPVNFIRDQITAFVNSQTGYIPIISAIETCLNPKYKKYADEYDNLFGVDNNTLLGTLKDIDPSDLSKAFKESWGKKWIKIGKKLFAFPSNFTETLTRKSEYVKARAKGYSVTESKRMADEITAAFGDRGLWFGNVGQVLTKSVPYFNSALQVVRQAGRAVNSKNVWKYLAATGLIAGAMLAYNKAILDSENEEEKRQHMQLMAEQLAMYIYVPNGKADGMIRIPIDQTYSWLGVLLTMLYNQSKGYDYKISDYVAGATAWLPDQINFFETVTNLLTEKDFSGLQKQIITSIPHLPRTILSGLFGKRTFPHVMDIVPKRLQRLEPRLQYDNRTSAVAKYLGDKLNLSPMKIDYFIDQGLGRTIRLGTRTTEASYGFLTDDKSWNENLKQMNPFVQQDFFSSGRIVQDFYDIKDDVDRLYISANEGLRKLTGKEMDLLKKYKGYTDSIGKTMGQYNKLVQYIRDNKYKMSESELNSNELKKKRVEKQLFDAIRKMKGWKVEEMSN